MPVIQNQVSIASSSANDNVITGSQFEYLPFSAAVSMGFNGSATGLLLDIYSGSDIICESFAPSVQNRFPIFPDDFTLRDVAAAGDRLKIRCRNTTGAALTLFYSVQIDPL